MRLPHALTVIAMAVTLEAAADNSAYLSKVYDFCPAPGQFVNVYPEYSSGNTLDDVIATIESTLCGKQKSGLVSLGAYGGYIVVGFDHPVVNVAGEYDFIIYGNAFSGSSEPGIVEVSVDENGNGLPDDTWYELAGSDYSLSTTLHGYQITYYRPDDNKTAEPDADRTYLTDTTYIAWSDNQDGSGYVMKNSYHTQSYWPGWSDDSTLTFTGGRLADNYVVNGSNYGLKSHDWGYVDDLPTASDPGFNIEWAVDSAGNPVSLSYIDFIKVYTAVNQYCGSLGETSTEIKGGEDFHPDATASDGVASPASDTPDDGPARIYSLSGRLVKTGNDVSVLPRGVYVVKTPTKCYKIIR